MGSGEPGVRSQSIVSATKPAPSKNTFSSLVQAAAPEVRDAAVAASTARAPALSHQLGALVHVIDELLAADLAAPGAEAPTEDAVLAVPRLPGDNPDDALRYLLRGLRTECRNLDACLAAAAEDPVSLRRRLGRLQPAARAAVQALSVSPPSGAGAALGALIGGLLDTSGLQSWECTLGLPERSVAVTRSAAATPEAEMAKPGAAKPEAERQQPAAAAPVTRAAPAPASASAAAGADDPLEIPLMLVRPSQGDWARELFARGLGYLANVTGEPPEKLREVVGGWLAQAGDDPRRVFRLLAKAQSRKVADPKAWVSDVLTGGEGIESAA